jgi:RNA polymerase sigma-70 factor (ECF subfamily)
MESLQRAPEQDPTVVANTPPSADPDCALLEALRAGDLRAAEALYRRHQQKVYDLARLITGDERDAEDVCQEAFVRAFRSLNNFRGEARFSSWLYRIAINQSRNLNDQKRAKGRLLRLVREPHSGAASIGQRSVVELRQALTRALGQLSPSQREILVCHDVLGLKHHEIAQALDCAEGTSKAQLHRARLRVREILTREGQT